MGCEYWFLGKYLSVLKSDPLTVPPKKLKVKKKQSVRPVSSTVPLVVELLPELASNFNLQFQRRLWVKIFTSSYGQG